MIHAICSNRYTNIAASPTNNKFPFPDQIEPIPIDAIIPLIEEEWKDEDYAYGEHYDNMYSKLSAHAAQLRHQRQQCNDPWLYQQLEKELADVEDELCKILLKFEELAPYPE